MLKSNATKAAGGSAAERTCEICLHMANVNSICVIVTGSLRKEKKKQTISKKSSRNKGVLYLASASVEEIHALSPGIFGAWHYVSQLVEKITIAF